MNSLHEIVDKQKSSKYGGQKNIAMQDITELDVSQKSSNIERYEQYSKAYEPNRYASLTYNFCNIDSKTSLLMISSLLPTRDRKMKEWIDYAFKSFLKVILSCSYLL